MGSVHSAGADRYSLGAPDLGSALSGPVLSSGLAAADGPTLLVPETVPGGLAGSASTSFMAQSLGHRNPQTRSGLRQEGTGPF